MKKYSLAIVLYFGFSSLALAQNEAQTASFILTDPNEVLKHENELVVVEGCVMSAKRMDQVNGKPIFLDMFAAYPNNVLTIAIWEEDQSKFQGPEAYDKKRVRVSGRAKKRATPSEGKTAQERVTISLHDPKQITILEDCQ